MIGVIAQKSGMSQLALENGDVVAVTWVKLHPNVVTQIKSTDKDGYNAVQLGSGTKKKRCTQPIKGHLKELEADVLREIRVDQVDKYHRGDKLDASVFAIGDLVQVTGISKGKGFAGTIKRHNFKSGPGGHGHDHHRQPGSIGPMGIPRVIKGMRMSGRMGSDQITTKNLPIIAIDMATQMIGIRGAVPGNNKSWIVIRKHE